MRIKKGANIKSIEDIDRPREKLIKYGPSKLSDAELLAILLGSGQKGENVIYMAERLLKKIGKEKITKSNPKELQKNKGIGPAKACEIVACFELGKRLLKGKKSAIYLTPHDVWSQMKDVRNSKKEHVVIFYLDSRNQEIEREIISVGTVNHSIVHPREIFEPAVKHIASHIILSHNHPSGSPDPSEEDLLLTARLVNAGNLMGIEITDHVIVTKNEYISMKERGLM